MDTIEIVKEIKKDNPYPEDIFGSLDVLPDSPSKSDIQARFSTFGRMVWNNCCDEIIKRMKEVKT